MYIVQYSSLGLFPCVLSPLVRIVADGSGFVTEERIQDPGSRIQNKKAVMMPIIAVIIAPRESSFGLFGKDLVESACPASWDQWI